MIRMLSLLSVLMVLSTSLSAALIPSSPIGVFNQLKSAKGILATQAPYLKVVDQLPNASFAIAMASEDSIFLDRASIDICRGMGSDSTDALAFILSHELAHYLLGHLDRHRFALPLQREESAEIAGLMTSASRSTQRQVNSVIKRFSIRHNETEADLEAGFISYLAGYRSLTAGPRFLDLAYAHYGLSPEEGKYASLAERKEMISSTAAMLDSLAFILEASNFALLSGQRQMALYGYEHIGQHYQSVDLLNNLAVLELKNFAQQYEGILFYELPTVLSNPSPPLFSDATPSFGDPDEMKALIAADKLRYQADSDHIDGIIAKLDKALEINPHFIPAYLNKSIAFYLRHLRASQTIFYDPPGRTDELEYAEAELLKAKNILLDLEEPSSREFINVYNMLAIINHLREDNNLAQEWLAQAMELDPLDPMSLINQGVIDGDLSSRIDAAIAKHDEQFQGEFGEMFQARDQHQSELSRRSQYHESLRLDSLAMSLPAEAWTVKTIKVLSSGGLLPESIVLAYTQTPTFSCYEWRKVRGRSTIIQRCTYIRPVSQDMLPASTEDRRVFLRGDSTLQILLILGEPLSYMQTSTHTFMHYRHCLLMISDAVLDSWVLYR